MTCAAAIEAPPLRYRARALVRDQPAQLGGVAVDRNGAGFVTDGVFADCRFLRVRGSD